MAVACWKWGELSHHWACWWSCTRRSAGILTHWGRNKMAVVFQTTFSNAFCWMKMYEFRLTFHWILFPRVQLTIFQHWFRQWLGAGQATSHYLNQWWLVYWDIYASLGLNELMNDYKLWQKVFWIPITPDTVLLMANIQWKWPTESGELSLQCAA